ncbi:hypothetical protein DWB85_10785 [Seongchinamella sediminis]|uniref:PA2779 family protein n=1 Tax=Seongchinamella sediminis TaxID=2283635 RepID=A0A3L7DYM5_9GAMM|nr:PA2779 family protein [Seongchinamella sediminis]RLQ21765.1 hypothetical protein DWB85_10785 [Seongchinamella sediminis]
MHNSIRNRFFIYFLVILLPGASLCSSVNAGVIDSRDLVQEQLVSDQRSELLALVSREDVARQLTEFGVDPANAQMRIASLTDAEVASLHQNIDELPAGSGVLGTIALVLLILILLDIAGVTDIFPKI